MLTRVTDRSALQANGFFGSSGISGRIPEGYTLLEQRFMRAVRASGRSWVPSSSHLLSTSNTKGNRGATVSDMAAQGEGKGVELTEWHKEGWTYHAKGSPLSFISLRMRALSLSLKSHRSWL